MRRRRVWPGLLGAYLFVLLWVSIDDGPVALVGLCLFVGWWCGYLHGAGVLAQRPAESSPRDARD